LLFFICVYFCTFRDFSPFPTRRSSDLLDAAFDPADVEAQAGQAAEAGMALGRGEVQRLRAPAHGLVHRALPEGVGGGGMPGPARSEEHTSELQSRENLVCRLLLEKKKN